MSQKVDPVINHLKDWFKSVYYPHCEVSIDKAMIPFKGHSPMKPYLPLKPVKRGSNCGPWLMRPMGIIMYDFNVYTGATR